MICLDILKDQWAAAMTLRTVLLSLQALLAAAEPDDPQVLDSNHILTNIDTNKHLIKITKKSSTYKSYNNDPT